MDGGGEGGSVCRVQRLVCFSMGIRKMIWCHIKKAVMNYHSHKFISCSRLAQGLQLELEGGRVTGETLVGVYKTLLEVSSHNLTFKLRACDSLMKCIRRIKKEQKPGGNLKVQNTSGESQNGLLVMLREIK